MASFAAQAALRAKWSSLVEEHSIEVPPEVTSKVTSVVGWLKQVNINYCFHLLHETCFLTKILIFVLV